MPPLSLDQIAMAAQEAKRQQQDEQIRQMAADMAAEIQKIESEDWKAPEGVDLGPYYEQPAPADWWIREQLAKELAKSRLNDEPKDDSTGFTIFTDDTD